LSIRDAIIKIPWRASPLGLQCSLRVKYSTKKVLNLSRLRRSLSVSYNIDVSDIFKKIEYQEIEVEVSRTEEEECITLRPR
jgi:hypothetical protein